MSKNTFLDTIVRQFSSLNWSNGIAIYRSGGVSGFQSYTELYSCRVKTGIGENYEVRIKVHNSGRFFQWMECSCQANRRRGEKCPHIAAFCVYVCVEKQNELKKMNIDIGNIDKIFSLSDYHHSNQIQKDENSTSQHFDYQSKMRIVQETKSILQDNSIETIFSKPTTEIISIDIDEEQPWVNLLAKIDDDKNLNYRFGVDDVCKLFFNTSYAKNTSKRLQKLISHDFRAKRIFQVKKNGNSGIILIRNIYLEKELSKKPGVYKVLKVEDLPGPFIGRYGIFVNKIGYIPFIDNMKPVQVSRWNDYAKTVYLDAEQSAALIENEFHRLKETADVILDEDVKKTKIYEKIILPELSLSKYVNGEIYIDAKIGAASKDDNVPVFTNSILEILKARAEGKKYIQTDKGFVKVTKDFDWLKNNIQNDGKIRLSTIDFIKFHEQLGQEIKIKGKADIIDKIRSGLLSRENLPLPYYGKTNLSLRPYQEEGLKWLWWLYSNSLGGLLADEMGLGKTHQTMALIASAGNVTGNALFLVVCPTTVIDHWLDKMKNFVPGVQCVCYHGAARKHSLKYLVKHKNSMVFVTSYGILLRDIEFLNQVKWNIVVLDEAHLVKNQTSRTYRAACKIKSQMRLCLTGTPLENDLFELKNLFDYIAPNYLGSDSEFKKKYMNVVDDERDPMIEMELHRLIHPFKMRRNKLEVLTDLPEKVEDIRYCHLNNYQRKLYHDTLNLKGAKLISNLNDENSPVPYIHVFSLISLLKQICDDPALIDPQYENIGSGKLELFDELLSEALESNQKVVVFSQYAKMINRLSQKLALKKINHVTLTGQTQNRGKIVKQFQEDENIKVFLGSLLAGGTGIDLTAASIVIHFDRWWNAAKEDQATDRIHRIGQVKNVQVYKLITKGTLEEKIDNIISRKKLIFEKFVEQDEEIFKHLSREDLLNILKLPTEEDFGISSEERHLGV